MSARRVLWVGMLAVLVPMAAVSKQPPRQVGAGSVDQEYVGEAVEPIVAEPAFSAAAGDLLKYTPLFPGSAHSGFAGGAIGQAQGNMETATSAADPPVYCEWWWGDNCHHPLLGWYVYSDRNTPFRAADDFRSYDLDPIVVSDLCWWGVHIAPDGSDCALTAPVDNFEVIIYANAGGAGGYPDSSNVAGTSTVTVPGKAWTGRTSDWDEYEYTGTLDNPITILSGGCYWIEITNDLDDTCAWLWAWGGRHARQLLCPGLEVGQPRRVRQLLPR